MKVIIGWILLTISSLISLRVMAIAAKNQLLPGFDQRSFFESEFEHSKRLQKIPGFSLLVFVGLALALLGMHLIGML